MRVTKKAISKGDLSAVLRLKLGNRRASWDAFLADCTRGKQSIEGIRLYPSCQMLEGPILRPMYAIDDIREFIRKVQDADSRYCPTPIKPFDITYDTDKGWRENTIDQLGNPVPTPAMIAWRLLGS